MVAYSGLAGRVLRRLLGGTPTDVRLAWMSPNTRVTMRAMDDDVVCRLVDAAREAWPNLAFDRDAFERYLRERIETDTANDAHAADLLLAFGCVQQDKAAIDALERAYLAKVPDFIHRVERSEAGASEVQQIVRERLLVGSSTSGPKIAEYGGRGPLGSWVRVVAIRVALEIARSRKPEIHDDDVSASEMVASGDPEMDYLRVRYAHAFRGAFSGALSALQERDRTVLQLYLVDGLNIEKIGKLYQVHRATVARWIATTRDQLYDDTRQRLREELNLNATEFESIVRLVRSQLDVSVRRILQEGAKGADSEP